MSGIYSTRFIAAHLGSETTFQVPDGYTAVLRCVTLHNDDSTGPRLGGVYLNPGGLWLARAVVPAYSNSQPQSSTVFTLRVVLRPDELLVAHGDTGVHLTASGYLFAV